MTVHRDALRELNIWPLRITGGQVFRLTITVQTPAGAAQDLTGCTLHLRVKAAITDADAAAKLSLDTDAGITHAAQSGGTLGQAEIRFEEAQTTALEDLIEADKDEVQLGYEVWVEDGAGDSQPVIDWSALRVKRGAWSPAP